MGTALPAIVLLRNGAAMVLLRTEAKLPGWPPIVVLRDPNSNEEAPLLLDEARFDRGLGGRCHSRQTRLSAARRGSPVRDGVGRRTNAARPPGRARSRRLLPCLLGVLAVSPVMFWRVMIDRVMYYGSMSTFTMICVAFLVLLVFETVFGHLRRYLVLFVTTRVDVKIWSHMFNKLLNLPIDFFERTPTGEIVHDMYEIYQSPDLSNQPVVWHLAGFLCHGDLSADHVHGQHDHDGRVSWRCAC